MAALLIEAVEALYDLSRDQEFALLVVVHPNRWVIQAREYPAGLRLLTEWSATRPEIQFLDLLEHFAISGTVRPDNVSEFFWEIDGHHNGLGYRAMGDGITQAVLGRGLAGERAAGAHGSYQP